MRADQRFRKEDKGFWAHVRSISEAQGYTLSVRKSKANPKPPAPTVRKLTAEGIVAAMTKLGLESDHLVTGANKPTRMGRLLIAYFAHRADVLNDFVQPRLMTAAQAKKLFLKTKRQLKPTLQVPSNKQKGHKAQAAYLTGLVNMVVESAAGPGGFNPNPGQLTTFTDGKQPIRTLSRRVDGALPGVVNPVALWEIKEYYYTTTFGSRVADGVYETLLDGMELEEMEEHTRRRVEHVLILDAHFTWWVKGRSYLCRIIDMLHMGYVDEVLFGREVVDVLPGLAKKWVKAAKARAGKEPQIRGLEEKAATPKK